MTRHILQEFLILRSHLFRIFISEFFNFCPCFFHIILLLVPALAIFETAHPLHLACGLEIVADKTLVGTVSCAFNNKKYVNMLL
jgi:hypothetical protein